MAKLPPVPIEPSMLEVQARPAVRVPSSVSLADPANETVAPDVKLAPLAGAEMTTTASRDFGREIQASPVLYHPPRFTRLAQRRPADLRARREGESKVSDLVQLLPRDEHNVALERNVKPPDWKNPKPDGRYNLVVIGAGTAGLVTAAGAAGLGARVAIIERQLMGGDCLTVGCVPSKGVISAARVARHVRYAGDFGVRVPGNVEVDFSRAMERMRRLRARISVNDSAERFRDLGIDVYLGEGSFVDSNKVRVGDATLEFKKAVIATGARASVPPIPGLDQVEYLTNETVFSLTELPRRLGVIGAGPIGCELAQSFALLGSEVFLQ